MRDVLKEIMTGKKLYMSDVTEVLCKACGPDVNTQEDNMFAMYTVIVRLWAREFNVQFK